MNSPLSRRLALKALGATTALAACGQIPTPSRTQVPAGGSSTTGGSPQATSNSNATTGGTGTVPAPGTTTTGGTTTGTTTGGTSAGTTTGGTPTDGSTLPCEPLTNVERGPFFVDTLNDPNLDGDRLIDTKLTERSDIRSDTQGGTGVQPGIPLTLTLFVNDVSTGKCMPLANARVDLWHCNAHGVYSDVQSTINDNNVDHIGQDFLRGYQTTDANGRVIFTTIVPGWYPSRAVHIHFKVRVFNGTQITTEATTQFFFDDAVCTQIFASDSRYVPGDNRVFNNQDGDFLAETTKLLVDLKGSASTGYAAAMSLAINTGTLFGG